MIKIINQIKSIKPEYWWLFALFFLSTLPYWCSYNYPFLLEWDDGRYLASNPHLELTWSNIFYQFTHDQLGLYTPLPMISLMIDHALGGSDAAIFHLHNILLLGLLSVGLFMILRQQLKVRPKIAAMAALIWAVMPTRVESVVWISERKDLTSGFFALATMYFFLRAAGEKNCSPTAALLFLLAGLSKPSTLPIIGLMVLYTWYQERQLKTLCKILWLQLISFGIIVSIYLQFMLHSVVDSAPNLFSWTSVLRILRYLTATILPYGINPIHPRQTVDPLSEPLALVGLLLVVAIVLWARRCKISPWELLLWGVGFVALWVPLEFSASNSNVDFADRYTILISALVWTCLARILEQTCQNFPRTDKPLPVIMFSWALYCAILTINYSPVFSDTIRLFSYPLEHNPQLNRKVLEGLAQVGFNHSSPELLEKSGQLFLLSSRQQTDERYQHGDFNMGCFLLGEAAWQRRDIGQAAKLLLPPLNGDAPPEIFNFKQYIGRWYLSASALNLTLKRPQQAQRLLRVMDQYQAGKPHELSFARGLRCYLNQDYNLAQQHWETARKQNPQDQRIQYNLKQLEQTPKMAE